MRGEIDIKKLITAIGTNELNIAIKEKEIYEVIGNDIPYQDGVLDILKGNSDISILILSELLVGEYDVKKFVGLIKEINPYIEIIFFMKVPNDELKTFLIGSGVKKVYIDNESSIEEIIKGISEVNLNSDLNLEIEMLKKMIEEKSISSNNEKEKNNSRKSKEFKISKTIAIAGNYGSGKSLVTAMLAKTAKKYKIKVIIIDFDIFNNSINNMFNVSNHNQIYKNIDQYIVKINENISIFSGIDLLFNETNKISFEKIKELLEKLKEKFDLILIDTSSETNLKYVKTAFANSEKIIFLVEPNLLEIKKAEELLEIYLEDWEIPSYKFGIVLNKVNVNSIDDEIVKNLFSGIKIIGKINFSKAYTALANNINAKFIGSNNYEKILKKIS